MFCRCASFDTQTPPRWPRDALSKVCNRFEPWLNSLNLLLHVTHMSLKILRGQKCEIWPPVFITSRLWCIVASKLSNIAEILYITSTLGNEDCETWNVHWKHRWFSYVTSKFGVAWSILLREFGIGISRNSTR